MASVAGHNHEEDFSIGETAGQTVSAGVSSSSPLENKDRDSVIGTKPRVKIHVGVTIVCDAGGQSQAKGPTRGANFVVFPVNSQEVSMGSESRQENPVQKEPALEEQAKETKSIDDVSLNRDNIFKDADDLDRAPLGTISQDSRVEGTMFEPVGEQDLAMQAQEHKRLPGYPTEELEPSISAMAGLGLGQSEKARGLEHPQLEVVGGTAHNAIAGHEYMEVDTAASIVPEQAILVSPPAGIQHVAQVDGPFEHGHTQAAHIEPAEVSLQEVLTANPVRQRPSLDATSGSLGVGIPEHFEKVKTKLHSMKSRECMRSASQATPSRSSKRIKLKLNFTPKRKVEDTKSGGHSSSSANPEDTSRNSSTGVGGLVDETLMVAASAVDSKDDLVLSTDPEDEGGASLGQQVDDSAAADNGSGASALAKEEGGRARRSSQRSARHRRKR